MTKHGDAPRPCVRSRRGRVHSFTVGTYNSTRSRRYSSQLYRGSEPERVCVTHSDSCRGGLGYSRIYYMES